MTSSLDGASLATAPFRRVVPALPEVAQTVVPR